MEQGLNDIQSGFVYNDKAKLSNGIQTLENSNAIFSNVDVSVFIPNNSKIQVTKNINENLKKDLISLRKSVNEKQYSDAAENYAKVVKDCIACHTIIRGW